MAFDRQAALDAGYTEAEINAHLRKPIEDTQPTYEPFSAAGNPILESVLQGVTFGFSDEMQAGLKTGIDKMTGDDRSFGDIYRQNVKDVRAPSEKFQKESPMTSLGLNLLGGIGTGGALGVAAKKTMPALTGYAKVHPLIAGSAAGTTAGGVSGAGFAPTMEEIPEYAGSGALTGGLFPPLAAGAGKLGGVVTKPLGALAKKAAGTLDTPKQRAARMTTQALSRDDKGLQDVLARQSQLGPESVLADVGGVNMQRLAQTISATPGRAANIAEKTLQERMMKSPERLIGRMRGVLNNNTSAYKYMKDTIEKRKQQASPLYKAAFDDDISVQPGAMDDLLGELRIKSNDFEGTSIGRSMKAVERSLVNKKKGGEIPKLEIRKLHAAKLDLDKKISDSIKEGRSTPLTAELMGVKSKLLDVLDTSENYKQARKVFSDDSSVLSSIEMGKKILKTDAEEMQDLLVGMSDAEKKGFVTGAMQAISNNLKGTKEGANAARKMASPLVKERLRNAFPNDAEYGRFVQGLEAEDIFAEVRNNVLRGSQTQQRLATAGESVADAGIDLARGQWMNTALNGIRNFFGGNAQIPEPIRDELAELLFRDVASGRETISRELAKRLKRHDIAVNTANNLLSTFRAGIPVASGEVGAILEQ